MVKDGANTASAAADILVLTVGAHVTAVWAFASTRILVTDATFGALVKANALARILIDLLAFGARNIRADTGAFRLVLERLTVTSNLLAVKRAVEWALTARTRVIINDPVALAIIVRKDAFASTDVGVEFEVRVRTAIEDATRAFTEAGIEVNNLRRRARVIRSDALALAAVLVLLHVHTWARLLLANARVTISLLVSTR